ncbi:MAG TPA: c-type cytochrome [Nitrospira sp.]
MDRSLHGRHRKMLLIVASLGCFLMAYQTVASPKRTTTDKGPRSRGNGEAGRVVFNGKGVCHYCHGIDGYRNKLPQLASDTATLIAQLNPPPSDLRNPKSLRLQSDKARAKAIREGHPGTGMFPTTTLTHQELADTLSYMSVLRKEGMSQPKP